MKEKKMWMPPVTAILDAYGNTIATGLIPLPDEKYVEPQLRLMTMAGEGVPAQSIYVGDPDGIRNLRDLCNKLLGETPLMK
jgi:hypothetical protein